MLQLLQHLGNGLTEVGDVPAPGPRAGSVLIQTRCSLVSAGTERMLVGFGRASLLGKARQQPERVRDVLAKVRANGLSATLEAIRSKLSQPIPLGYCNVGVVVDGGGARHLSPGDRVLSNGSHAEVVSVGSRLCARVPDGVTDEVATFGPLAAIALQGIHLLGCRPGDKVVVTGLGLIGQLAVRILKVRGCEVLGLDPSAERSAMARAHGAEVVEAGVDPVTAALSWTRGKGVAGVLITASTDSNLLVNQAARSCGPRGKVVLVGVVGLLLNRADFYRNEVSFQVSCSYGDRRHEGPGSTRANFDDVLGWMASGKLSVNDLISHRLDFTNATEGYRLLEDRRTLGILMRYREGVPGILDRTVSLGGVAEAGSLGLVGAGNFALRTLLPALAKVPGGGKMAIVASNQGHAALLAARRSGAAEASTDEARVLSQGRHSAVFLTTRHDVHARQAQAAMAAGKSVWVEKPLALSLGDVDAVIQLAQSAGVVLMVGFNRRFAPAAARIQQARTSRGGPCRMRMVINAGRLDPDHWTLDPVAGGGRIVGEACHFIDLARFIAGASIRSARCVGRDTDGQDGAVFELGFADGSKAWIEYRTDLPSHVQKERIEVEGDGWLATIHNWARLTSKGVSGCSEGWPWSKAPRKGHEEALAAFLGAVRGAAPVPIPLNEIREVSRAAVVMQGMGMGDVHEFLD